MKEFIKYLAVGISLGVTIAMSILAIIYLMLSFTYWQWMSFDWIFVRGFTGGCIVFVATMGVLAFIHERN